MQQTRKATCKPIERAGEQHHTLSLLLTIAKWPALDTLKVQPTDQVKIALTEILGYTGKAAEEEEKGKGPYSRHQHGKDSAHVDFGFSFYRWQVQSNFPEIFWGR